MGQARGRLCCIVSGGRDAVVRHHVVLDGKSGLPDAQWNFQESAGVTQADERVLGVGVEPVRFYLNAPLETFSDSTRASVLRTAAAMGPDESLVRMLRSYGFSHMLVARAALGDSLD